MFGFDLDYESANGNYVMFYDKLNEFKIYKNESGWFLKFEKNKWVIQNSLNIQL